MKHRALVGTIGVVMIGALIAVVLIIFNIDAGGTVKEFSITTGSVGAYRIGDSKQSLLAATPDISYSTRQLPSGCSQNWIKAKSASPEEWHCILDADVWEVGDGISGTCPVKTDSFAELHFVTEKLVSIEVNCTQPE